MDKRKTGLVVSVWMAFILLVAVFGVVLNVPLVRGSGTIYIRADGSIDPPTASIQCVGNAYTFTDNIYDSIAVERDNIIVDGAGYKLQGIGVSYSKGVYLTGKENVTIRNVEIRAFEYGIYLNRSQNTRIIGNKLTNGTINSRGICLDGSSNNAILRNNITSNFVGIGVYSSNNNNIFENNITDNGYGLYLSSSSNNTISGNEIVKNTHWAGGYGAYLIWSPDNTFCHNNFIDNDKQVSETRYPSAWDDGYPSGGNYWSDFEERYPDVKDVYSGPYQNKTGSDGIWDHFYEIGWMDGYIRDNYPLVNPCAPFIYHELVVFTLTTPDWITLGDLLSLNATVTNQGSSDETNVEFLLLINGTIVNSMTIPLLKVDSSQTLSYLWTPTVKGTYNVTAYAHPVSGETWVRNNQQTKFITVWAIGIKTGDWIKYVYSYKETPATPYTERIKVEFLSVEGTTVTIRGTMLLSDGTEQNDTFTVNIVGLYPWMYAPVFDTLSGFVMLANSTVGDTAYIGYTDGKTCARISTDHPLQCFGSKIESETERTYVGTLRTAVYAEYSSYFIEYGPLTCYWDKQTGVLVEVSNTRSDGWTAKAVETNMWEALPSGLPIDHTYLYILAAVVTMIAIGSIVFLARKKKKPPEIPTSPVPVEAFPMWIVGAAVATIAIAAAATLLLRRQK